MAFIVNQRIEVSLFIDDNEYPLDTTNVLKYLHIATTFRNSVPVLSMQIADVRRVFDRLGLLDGTPLRVVVKPNGKDSKTYRFLKFNHKRELKEGTYVWTIWGYWDAPLFWAGTSVKSIRGTANAVLEEISKTCGLKYDGTTTNDAQLWTPRNMTYRAWAKDIALQSWASDKSCMALGLDLNNTLRLKDLNNLPQPQKKIVAYQYEKDAFTAVDVQVSADSGLNNALTGYQNMRISQSTTQPQMITTIKDLAFTPDSKSPLYNTELRKELNRGAVRFGPIDCGNVHDNYERASYQNVRYTNLFSLGLDILLADESDFNLGEKVVFSIQNEDTGQDSANSGTYTVSGHALYIQGINYTEKLSVVRHGTNEVQR